MERVEEIGEKSGCCHTTLEFEGMDPAYKRALIAVIVINATMFFVEMSAGFAAQSQALKTDALDFLADSLTYGLSFWAIGKSAVWRARTALLKGASLTFMGLAILGTTAYQVFMNPQPVAQTMGLIGALALAANVMSVLLLMRYRNGDANVRSVWLCSRNDAIGNVAVIGAAGAVMLTGTAWPDLVVAAAMAALFLTSAYQITLQSLAELRAAEQREVMAS